MKYKTAFAIIARRLRMAQLRRHSIGYIQSGLHTSGGAVDILSDPKMFRIALDSTINEIICIRELHRGRLFIVQQNLDTSTPMGQMFYAMLGIMSEFEYHLKRERQTEGIARAKSLGKYTGRKSLPTNVREQVLQLLAQNVRPTKIATDLGIGRTNVYKYCQSSPE